MGSEKATSQMRIYIFVSDLDRLFCHPWSHDDSWLRHTHAPSDDHGQFRRPGWRGISRVAVVATLSKGYDLDYIWKQVDQGLVKDAASYYLQASESGGEPTGKA
jgi:hypothetical protein